MTAGNASPLSDGASAVVLASEAKAAELGIAPMARILASATVAVDPTIMGIAPAYAIPKAIARAGLTPEQIDVYEIHEAFAAQVLAVLREFPKQTGYTIPDDRLNPNGGAVALGHPFGDSGTRLLLSLATELERHRKAVRRDRRLRRIRPRRRDGTRASLKASSLAVRPSKDSEQTEPLIGNRRGPTECPPRGLGSGGREEGREAVEEGTREELE